MTASSATAWAWPSYWSWSPCAQWASRLIGSSLWKTVALILQIMGLGMMKKQLAVSDWRKYRNSSLISITGVLFCKHSLALLCRPNQNSLISLNVIHLYIYSHKQNECKNINPKRHYWMLKFTWPLTQNLKLERCTPRPVEMVDNAFGITLLSQLGVTYMQQNHEESRTVNYCDGNMVQVLQHQSRKWCPGQEVFCIRSSTARKRRNIDYLWNFTHFQRPNEQALSVPCQLAYWCPPLML